MAEDIKWTQDGAYIQTAAAPAVTWTQTGAFNESETEEVTVENNPTFHPF